MRLSISGSCFHFYLPSFCFTIKYSTCSYSMIMKSMWYNQINCLTTNKLLIKNFIHIENEIFENLQSCCIVIDLFLSTYILSFKECHYPVVNLQFLNQLNFEYRKLKSGFLVNKATNADNSWEETDLSHNKVVIYHLNEINVTRMMISTQIKSFDLRYWLHKHKERNNRRPNL